MKSHRAAYGPNYFFVVSLVIHEDAVKVVRVLDVAHGAIGEIDQRIHVFVAVGNRVLEHADDFVRDAVNADTFAQRVLTGEQFLFHRRADDRNATVSKVFLFSPKGAVANFQSADSLVTGKNSMDAVGSAARSERDLTLLINLRRDSGEHRHLSPHVVEI